MTEPARPSKVYIERRIYFHESGARWYAQHGQTALEVWSRQQAEVWREKLKGREPGDGE